ncbi:MAG TPA: SAM-dependent chlorinase/fluorinase [Dehalococcoidia bacterium]|nr:SAM-dependent chlorinase/fluorinase [Dehalococcoidia bacterium]
MPPRPVVALLTDFGLGDPYVGTMKGVILSLNPDAVLVDISHGVRPQAVEQGAFLLEQAHPYFPPGTVFLAVVDPGVGTSRHALALRTPHALWVGPDNGLLSAALPEATRQMAGEGLGPVPLPEGYAAVSIENERYFRQPVSATFHGRDIFAPAAAHLSLGMPLEVLGPPLREVMALPPFRARPQPDGSLLGRVVHVDRFGNLVTSVRRQDLPEGPLEVEVCGRRLPALVRTYGEAQGLCALIGSAGYLEIAVSMGSAAEALGASIGTPVLVRPL